MGIKVEQHNASNTCRPEGLEIFELSIKSRRVRELSYLTVMII